MGKCFSPTRWNESRSQRRISANLLREYNGIKPVLFVSVVFFDQIENSDWSIPSKWTTQLCERAFKSLDVLRKHEVKSDLHKVLFYIYFFLAHFYRYFSLFHMIGTLLVFIFYF